MNKFKNFLIFLSKNKKKKYSNQKQNFFHNFLKIFFNYGYKKRRRSK